MYLTDFNMIKRKKNNKTRCGMQPRTDDDDKKERRNIVQGHAQARREKLKATKNI